MKRLPVKFTIFFSGILISLVISESILQLFWKPPYLDPKYRRDDFFWMSKNVVLNNFGYRDNEAGLDKFANMLRIYSLGDSFTYGWYIDDPGFSYPNILEEELNKRFGKDKVEVINAANPGFKIQDSLDRFRSEGVLFSPDIVTLGINLFDITNKEFKSEKPKFQFLKNLRLYEVTFGNVERAKVARLTANELRRSIEKDSDQIRHTKKLIEELGSLVTREGATLIIVIFPEYDSSNPNEPYPYGDFHSRMEEIVSDINRDQSLNIKVIDLLETFESIPDKKELVLNPTDNHPTIKANKITASQIIKDFDFDFFIVNHKPVLNDVKRKSAVLGESLEGFRGIIRLEGEGNKWVYFDRVFDLGAQEKILPNSREKKIPFMPDLIKTAKSSTHEGWVGAKLELHFSGAPEIIMDKNYLEYEIAGVHQVTSFKRENGSTFSKNHDLSGLEIKRNNQTIKIKILSGDVFDFHRVYLDVSVNQMDIDKGKIVSFFATDTRSTTLKKNNSSFKVETSTVPGSLPVFAGSEESYNYVWYGDSLKRAKLTNFKDGIKGEFSFSAREDVIIEVPFAGQFKESSGPTVIYL